jgi:basic membrane protein A
MINPGIHNRCMNFILSLLITVSLVSCEKDEPDTPKKINVLFTTTGLGDLSFADNLYQGILKAYNDFDFEVEYAFPSDLENATIIMKEWIDSTSQKDELIIVLGQEYCLLVDSFQGNFNKKKILLIDARASNYPDLISIEFSFFGAAFQAGVAAGQFSNNDTAGIIAAMHIPPIDNAVQGFMAGFTYANGVFTEVQYIDTIYSAFKNVDKAVVMAEDLFTRTNIIFGLAGNANQGIFETLRKTENVYAIGVDQDQSWLAPDKIIGSAIKQIDKVAYNTIRDFMNDDFHPGYEMAGLESDYISFKINPVFEGLLMQLITDCFDDALQAEQTFLNTNP